MGRKKIFCPQSAALPLRFCLDKKCNKRFYELTNIDVYVILFKVRDSHISLSFPQR